MQARWVPVFVVLVHLAMGHPSWAVTLTPESQKELLKKADDWQVPQPKPEWMFYSLGRLGRGSGKSFIHGFVDPGDQSRALVGFTQKNIISVVGEFADPSKLSVDNISVTENSEYTEGVNVGLIIGIQLLRRGEDKLGVSIINKALTAASGNPRSVFYSPGGENPVLMLARSCLASAINDITSEHPDYQNIKERIERLISDQPILKNEATDWALEALKANVAHNPAPKDTIEHLIDDYLMDGETEGIMAHGSGSFTRAQGLLLSKGFEAVPSLLEQRHSKRFTNHVMLGFNNFISFPMNAEQVISGYLPETRQRRPWR